MLDSGVLDVVWKVFQENGLNFTIHCLYNMTIIIICRMQLIMTVRNEYFHMCFNSKSVGRKVLVCSSSDEFKIYTQLYRFSLQCRKKMCWEGILILPSTKPPNELTRAFLWKTWVEAVLNNLSIGCNYVGQIGREGSKTRLISTISNHGGQGAGPARRRQAHLPGNHDNTIPQTPPNSIPNSITRVVIKNSQWHSAPSHLQNAQSTDIIPVPHCRTVSNC